MSALADSRIENIEAMRLAQVPASMTLIRSPMLSQAERVVMYADVSFNTEIEVIRKLSLEAQKVHRTHGIVLMVELGDLREGIMPDDLIDSVRETLSLPNIVFKGSGVSPDARNMVVLSELADSIEATFGLTVDKLSTPKEDTDSYDDPRYQQHYLKCLKSYIEDSCEPQPVFTILHDVRKNEYEC